MGAASGLGRRPARADLVLSTPADSTPEIAARPGAARLLAPALLTLFVVGSILVLQRLDVGRALSIENMRALLDSYAPYGPLVFMGILIAGFYLRLPQFMVITVGGMLFERTHAFVYCWIAAVLGTASTFLLVRFFARDAFQRLLITRFRGLQALDAQLERHGFVTVLGLRLVLFLSSPLNWAIGATRVRIPHYLGGTALGIVPGIAGLDFEKINAAGGRQCARRPQSLHTLLRQVESRSQDRSFDGGGYQPQLHRRSS